MRLRERILGFVVLALLGATCLYAQGGQVGVPPRPAGPPKVGLPGGTLGGSPVPHPVHGG